MRKAWLILLLLPLLFIACGGDDDDDNNNDDNPYEGPNYRVNAEFTMSDAKDGDTLIVYVRRLNPESDEPDESVITIEGITLILIEYDPYDSVASFGTGDLSLIPEDSMSFEFRCGEDSIITDFGVPPSTRITITSPVRAPGDTTYPQFAEGAPIPVTWEYEGAEPPYVECYFVAVNVPNMLEYYIDVPGSQTSCTFSGDSTHGFGGPVSFPLPTIVLSVKDSLSIHDDDNELYLSVNGMPAMTYIQILDTDTTGDVHAPAVSVTGSGESTVFDWEPADGAMMMTVYRDSENHGQDHTGAIWTLGCNDGTVDAIVPPITFGVAPEGTFSMFGPDEEIIAGEDYSVVISWHIPPESGIVGGTSWSTGGK